MGETATTGVSVVLKGVVQYDGPLWIDKKNFVSDPINSANLGDTEAIVDRFVGEVTKFYKEEEGSGLSILLCQRRQTGTKTVRYRDFRHGEFDSSEVAVYADHCRPWSSAPADITTQAILGWVKGSEELAALKKSAEGEAEAAAALPANGTNGGANAAPADSLQQEPAKKPAPKKDGSIVKPAPVFKSSPSGTGRMTGPSRW